MYHRLLLLVLSVFLGFSITACTNKSYPQSPEGKNLVNSGITNDAAGTSDVGGGTTGESKPEQIKAAVEDARVKLLTDEVYNYFRSLFLLYRSTNQEGLYKEVMNDLEIMMSLINLEYYSRSGEADKKLDQCLADGECSMNSSNIREFTRAKMGYPVPHYISDIKVFYKSDSYCPANDKTDADASVAYTLKGEICFSTFSLKKIPPASIKNYVFGLWIHELAHMHGHNEEVANKMRDLAVEGYSYLFEESTPMEKILFRVHLQSINGVLSSIIKNIKLLRDCEMPDCLSNDLRFRSVMLSIVILKEKLLDIQMEKNFRPFNFKCEISGTGSRTQFDFLLVSLSLEIFKISDVFKNSDFKNTDLLDDEFLENLLDIKSKLSECLKTDKTAY